MKHYFSQKVNVFHGRSLPEEGYLVGYALLIQLIENQFKIGLPLPDILAIATEKHQRYERGSWKVFTIRHKPNDDIKSHLVFALKYEALDLYILKKFFELTGKEVVLRILDEEPTSKYTRRIWFLYEWLLDEKLDVPDLNRNYRCFFTIHWSICKFYQT